MSIGISLFSRPFFLVLGSAILYITAYDAPAYAYLLGFVALVPFFFFLRNEHSVRRIFWYGFLFGIVTIAGSIVWFLSTYPLEWAGIENRFAAAVIVLAIWAATSALLGLFLAFFAVLVKKFARNDWGDFLLIPSLWVLMEFLRALTLSLLFLGSQSSLGADWTFGFFGHTLVWSSLLTLFAPLGGVYLLSFIGVLINYAVFLVLYRMQKRGTLRMVLVVAGVLSVLYIADQATNLLWAKEIPQDTTTVAIVTTNFPAAFIPGFLTIGTQANTLKNLLNEAVRSSPDIIVLPEDSRALAYIGTTTVQSILDRASKEILLIDSSPISLVPGTLERMVFYSSHSGIIGTSDKVLLMPYGEYLPHIAVTAANLFGFQGWLSAFDGSRGFQKGTATPIIFQGHTFGVLFCSEIIPESLYRELAGNGAELLFNVAAHADFQTGKQVLYNQTLSVAKMKAASNGRFFIQAGNDVPSFFMDAHGNILGESTRGEDGVMVVQAGFSTAETPYTRFGDWLLIVALLIVTGSLLRTLFLRKP